jgi:N-acetylmuramic acid 6-phosphate etherase
MVKLGMTYGNLMANVRPINMKLKKRAIEIIAYAAGCKEEEAFEAFEKVGGNAKAAILMLIDNNCAEKNEELSRERITGQRGSRG